MHILVLGAGVVGITTAWFLQKQGHQVTVVDRQNRAGLETSYANGGQISVSHAQPWANPSAPLKVLKWLAQPDAPLLFRPKLDPAQWRWALSFLGQCTSARAAHNIRQMVNLGTYSRSQLQALRKDANVQYDHLEKGILHFYTNPAEFESAKEPTRIMQSLGCDRQIIDADQAVELEPALKPIRNRIAGAQSPITVTQSKPIMRALETVSFVIGAPGIEFDKVSINNRTVSLSLRVEDIAQAEQINRSLRTIDDSLLRWSSMTPRNRGNKIEVTYLANWRESEGES